MYLFIALISGIIFGAGLTIAQMINPTRIIGFLDIFGQWDPTLLFVMIGALPIALIGYQLLFRYQKPILVEAYALPTRTQIDRPLIIGSAIFGMGWAMTGYCPGPVITALGITFYEPAIVFLGMIIGSIGCYFYHNFFK